LVGDHGAKKSTLLADAVRVLEQSPDGDDKTRPAASTSTGSPAPPGWLNNRAPANWKRPLRAIASAENRRFSPNSSPHCQRL
jgi:phage terminase small subunit